MDVLPVASAVRPGEHACCRFALASDRQALTLAFVRNGIERGHKVLHVADSADNEDITERLRVAAPEGERSGRYVIETRTPGDLYLPDGTFDRDRTIATIRAEHAQALAEGFSGLSISGSMNWVLGEPPGADGVTEYEHCLAALAGDPTLLMLCHYEHGRFASGALTTITAAHDVDLAPELAAIGRFGYLAGARVDGQVLRLSGELDFACADALADMLAAYFHGRLRLDLSDLTFADVAGMRALRGRLSQPLTIVSASAAILRLLALLAWDTDPDIEVLDSP
ncbi:MAG: hypothetical protein QOG15_3687 [Solirubrobacteraceae bacterium]|jgi:ABC-type transporter Mla MlaB component|nr:hypothetical protein [Solirubrobacteraceae bacterium]